MIDRWGYGWVDRTERWMTDRKGDRQKDEWIERWTVREMIEIFLPS